MIIVRQSTARIVTVGPVLDADGVAVTGGVVADFKISKNGGAPAALNGSATLTHRNTGHYSLSLTTSDTDTVGQAEIVIDDTVNACPIKELTVVEEAVYDALFAASAPGYGTAQTGDSYARLGAPAGASIAADLAAIEAQTDDIGAAGAGLTALASAANLATVAGYIDTEIADIQSRLPAALVGGRMDANVGAISGDATAADNLETMLDDTAGAVPWAGIVDQGTAQSATGTTLVLRAAAAFADDTLIGATLMVFGSTQGYWQSRTITDSVLSTDTVTVDAWTVTPSGTITYKIFATAPSTGGGGGPTANQIAEAMFTYDATADYSTADAGSVVKQIADNAGGSSLTVADIADGVWDELLTTGAHNSANSAGRRLRTLQDVGNYTFGAVWLDTNSANTGTTFPEDGTFLNPCNTLARAGTVAAAATQAIKRFFVMNGSSITLAATYSGYDFDGDGYTLALGGQNISNSVFKHFGACSGTATGTVPIFDSGLFTNVTLPPCVLIGVGLNGTLTVGSAGDYLLLNCHSQVAGASTPTIDMGSGVGATTMSIRRWSGGLTLANVQTGDVVSVDAISGGTITVGGSGGTVHIRGMVNVTDSSGGAVTIVQTNVMDARFDTLDSAVDALPTNAELATALGTADDAVLAAVATVDTVVDAIKAKTDSLTFTTAGMVDSAIKRVGNTTLNAAGTGGQGYGA